MILRMPSMVGISVDSTNSKDSTSSLDRKINFFVNEGECYCTYIILNDNNILEILHFTKGAKFNFSFVLNIENSFDETRRFEKSHIETTITFTI